MMNPLCRASAALLLLVLGARAEEFRLERVLPQRTWAFASAPDLAAALLPVPGSPIRKIWEEEEVQTFLKPLLGKQGLGRVEEELRMATGLGFDQALKLLHGRFAVGLLGVRQAGHRRPVDLVASLHVGAGKGEVEKLLARYALNQEEEIEGVSVLALKVQGNQALRFFWQGETLVVATSLEAVRTVLRNAREKPEQTVATSGTGRDAVTSLGDVADQQVVVQLLPKEALKGLAVLEEFPKEVGEMLRLSGYARMERVLLISQSVPAGTKEMASYAPADLGGVWRSLEGRGRLALLDAAPADTLLYAGGRVDLPVFWDEMGKLLRSMNQLDPDAGFAELEQGVRKMEETFKFRGDLLPALGREVAFLLRAPEGGGLVPDLALLVELRDPEAANRVLATAAEEAKELRETSRSEFETATLWSFQMKGEAAIALMPAVAVTERHLVAGLFVNSVKKMVRRLPTRGPSLADEPAFRKALSAAGARREEVPFLTWVDTARLCGWLHNVVSNFLPMIPTEDLPVPIDFSLFPTAEAFTRPLTPMLSVFRREEDAWMQVQVGPWGNQASALLLMGALAVLGLRSPAQPFVFTMPDDRPPPPAPPRAEGGADRVLDLDLKGTRLDEALERLSKDSGLNLLIEVGTPVDCALTVRSPSIKVLDALTLVCSLCGARAVIDGDTIRVAPHHPKKRSG